MIPAEKKKQITEGLGRFPTRDWLFSCPER
jgi:hypothetical protein